MTKQTIKINKSDIARALGRLGGQARAKSLTAAKRSAIARKAATSPRERKGWPKGKPRTPKS